MPGLAGYHHVTLTVSDIDRSLSWYTELLGLSEAGRREQDGMTKAVLRDDASGIMLVLVSHGGNAVVGDFDEFHTGLDHLAFAVADRSGLESWRDRLEAAGVPHSGITAGSVGELLAFRDPDNIALEFYTLA